MTVQSLASDLLEYIGQSPSPFHCVAHTAERLESAGFEELNLTRPFSDLGAGDQRFVSRGGTLIAWRVGSEPIGSAGFRIIGAHTDSPNLRLKPRPDLTREGYDQWAVEVYGGVLLSTWMDRDLGISGRVVVQDKDTLAERLIRIDRPIARIPNLAIHLNRSVNKDGLKLNAQTHMNPMVGLEAGGHGLKDVIAKELDCSFENILSWDLGLHDVQAPSLGGLSDDFVFAPRLDNQASCHAAVRALTSLSEPSSSTAVVVLFDHEECGSTSGRGAASSLLLNVLRQIERATAGATGSAWEQAVANSFTVSVDMAHGVHPNYSDRHDSLHKPVLNAGPVIKTNVNMRYATDAVSSAWFKRICNERGVPTQEFINRNDLACGSTIGPISAAELAIPTLDIGSAMLSMHSIREQGGAQDVAWMIEALAGALTQT